MKKRMLFISLGILMGISIVFYSCSNTNNPVATTGGTGILKINMIDAPASFSKVNIRIDSVQAHISTANDNSGWTTLNNLPSDYDLSLLVNGNSTVIAEDTLPAGKYSQIRLYLGTGDFDNYVILEGQTQHLALTTPSGTQSGIKLNVDATIKAGITYELTVDFDAAKSIVTTGSPTSPKYILKPVIRVVTTATTGIISGVVLPDTVSSEVWAASPTDSISTSTDASGAFKFFGLFPDTYKIYIFPLAPNDTAYNNMIISDVVVTAGSTTDLGTINLSEAGSISGTVSPDTAEATITATLTTDTTKIYSINTDGTSGDFKLYLPPGTYNVVIKPFDTNKYEKEFNDVDVTAGTTTDLNGGAVIDLATQ